MECDMECGFSPPPEFNLPPPPLPPFLKELPKCSEASASDYEMCSLIPVSFEILTIFSFFFCKYVYNCWCCWIFWWNVGIPHWVNEKKNVVSERFSPFPIRFLSAIHKIEHIWEHIQHLLKNIHSLKKKVSKKYKKKLRTKRKS